MRHTLVSLALAALTGHVHIAAAQQPSGAVRDRVLAALELPGIIDSIRRRGGIPEEEVRVVVEEARRKNIPARETRDVLKETDNAIRDHGPVDNFGAFVKARLDAGLRGRALAQAIRQEHSRRGIGKGNMRGASRDAGARRQDPGAQRRDSDDTTRGKGKGQSKASTKGKGRP